jgi:hypothetical protein
MTQPDYTTPHGEPWDVVAAAALAFVDEPEGAAEGLRILADRGYRIVPVNMYDALLDAAQSAEHAASFASKGQGRTPVLTQQIVAELEAALARLRTLMEGDRS